VKRSQLYIVIGFGVFVFLGISFMLARSLTATGLSTDRAYEIALAAEADIAQSGRESISFARLGELA
jgi:2-phosphoglycerate kinase